MDAIDDHNAMVGLHVSMAKRNMYFLHCQLFWYMYLGKRHLQDVEER